MNTSTHIDVSPRSMSVELTFCHLGENLHHGINSHFDVGVEVQNLRTIVKETPANEFVYAENLNKDIKQV